MKASTYDGGGAGWLKVRPSLLAAVLAAVLILTGCGAAAEAPGPEGQSPADAVPSASVPASADASVPADAQPTEGPPSSETPGEGQSAGTEPSGDSTQENQQEDPVRVAVDAVRNELVALASSEPRPGRDQMRDALVRAGVPADAVEVSLDATPTGLDVDAISAAAPVEGQCVFGEVRDGEVVVSVLPLLDSGLCFVGDQR